MKVVQGSLETLGISKGGKKMATARKTKVALEVLFARAELKGIPERALLKSRNMVQVDMIWPRSGIAKKSAMREAVFKKGVCTSRTSRGRSASYSARRSKGGAASPYR